MYIPLSYWKFLENDSSIIGPRGGKRITYKNVGRYFNNTEFVYLTSQAWVGTTINESSVLKKVIRQTLEAGKAAAIAIKSDKPEPDDLETNQMNLDKFWQEEKEQRQIKQFIYE